MTENFDNVRVIGKIGGDIHRIKWSADGTYLSATGQDGKMRFWEIGIEPRLPHDPVTYSKELPSLRIEHPHVAAWSPDMRWVATTSLQSRRGLLIRRTNDGHIVWDWHLATDDIRALDWSLKVSGSTQQFGFLAVGNADGVVQLLSATTGDQIGDTLEHDGEVTCVAISPDSQYVAVGNSLVSSSTVTVWEVRTGQLHQIFSGHDGSITSLAWWPDSMLLASGSTDNTIRIWNVPQKQLVRTRTIHSKPISSLVVADNGRLLFSKAKDEAILVWSRLETWEPVVVHSEPRSSYAPCDMAMHPTLPLLASVYERDAVCLYTLDFQQLHQSKPNFDFEYYSNAKVVVVGEGSAGKTQLSRALLRQPFADGFGTDGVNVGRLPLDNLEAQNGVLGQREVYLWDLAGQGSFKLVHQLYMGDVALALLVFDGNKDDPLKGLRSWAHIINEAQAASSTKDAPLLNNGEHDIKMLLVEARTDQGGFGNLSEQARNDFCAAVNATRFHRTSAKTRDGIDELRESIVEQIDWRSLPQNITHRVFVYIREFFQQLKDSNTVEIATVQELYDRFLESDKLPHAETLPNLRSQFEACIRFLEARQLVRRFDFGDLVLLKPELLNSYAHAIIRAARQGDSSTLGYVDEQDIWRADIDFAKEKRILNPEQESWMLISTVHDLIKYEVALRHERKLIFPSYLASGNGPDFKQVGMEEVEYAFEGLAVKVYSVLVVRLTQSNYFNRKQLARYKAQFQAEEGGLCGITLDASKEVRGRLTLHFEPAVQQVTRFTFDLFVYTLLRKLVGHNKVRRTRFFSCTNPRCSTYLRLPFDLDVVEARRNNGKTDIICPVCEERTQLIEPSPETMDDELKERLRQMNRNASQERDRQSAEAALEGKRATDNFDVFFFASQRERSELDAVEEHMAYRGIYCFPSVPESLNDRQLLDKVTSLAVFIGEHGLRRGELATAEALIGLSIERHRRVVIVLFKADSSSLKLMEQFRAEPTVQWVYFFGNLADDTALDDLEAAITGKEPR
ncbi:MAG: hypothetical protein GYB67_03085 [Chloroflexi bacterium]|nr:hypothetical protein [Chloroflexota bacterium]